MDWKDLENLVGRVAPEAGLLLGGPVGAGIGGLISAALGVPNTPQAVAVAVQSDPEAGVKIQQMLSDERIKIAQMQSDYKIAELTQANAALQAQVDVNKVESQSTRLFVAGWRPYAGWIGGTALAYVAIVEPVARFVAVTVYHYGGAFPAIDTTITFQVLLGMLGLGSMRTMEKMKGAA